MEDRLRRLQMALKDQQEQSRKKSSKVKERLNRLYVGLDRLKESQRENLLSKVSKIEEIEMKTTIAIQ